jgi:phosphatidylglycerophosphate synthase
MKPLFLSFIKNLGIFSLLLAIVIGGFFFLLPRSYFTPALPGLLLFFIGVTLAGFYILIRASARKFIRFINLYLLITVIKLVVFIAILVIYLLLNKKDAVPFGLWFFLLYIFFTFFEVVSLLSYSKSLQQ